jgi:hypothetical protein
MIDLGHGYGYGHSWAVVSPALKNVDIRKAAQKAARNGCPFFLCPISAFGFLHTLPTGKGKKADIYQKRRFAFGFVFYRFCAAFLSKYFVYYIGF